MDPTDATAPLLARPHAAAGRVIAGRYRLEARLGAGGGGTVWRCTDTALGATVALKILARGGDAERWRREVAIARRIADRNVCRVHDLGEADDVRFVTMELVEGESLRARIAAGLPAAAARALFEQIVAGAAAIHAAGVVHRDLKPDNVVVAGDGRAVIVDFGVARAPAAPAVTGEGAVIGTPRYMAPEQAAGGSVDARADVYALGLVGKELLAGGAWPRAERVLARCLAREPERRFADARALQAALGGARGSRRWLAIALGAAAAAAAVVAVAAARDSSPPRAPTLPVVAPPTLQPVTDTAADWPAGGVASVALSPDAARLAYTTGGGKLLVRPLASGSAVAEAWPAPKLRAPGRWNDGHELFGAAWAVGWFPDGAVAELGSTIEGDWALVRVPREGEATRVWTAPARFAAAIAPDGRVALGVDGESVTVLADAAAPLVVARLPRDARVAALAWSPDGARIAVALASESTDEATVLDVPADREAAPRVDWRGACAPGDTLLAWLDAATLAFGHASADGRAAVLESIDVAAARADVRLRLVGERVGPGSAARGTLVALRGTARPSVQVGDSDAWPLAPLHDRAADAAQLAGWTSDGRAVFAVGEGSDARIVRATPGASPEPWPDARGGDRAQSVVGDSVLGYAEAGGRTVVLRLGATGERTELATLDHAAGPVVVRCAGDRAAPCVLVESGASTATFTALDPQTGARGAALYHPLAGGRPVRDAALSPDGAQLAFVDGGSDVTVLDLATGTAERPPSAGPGASLQSLAYAPGGELWAAALGYKGRRFALLAFGRSARTPGAPHFISSPLVRGSSRDALRAYGRIAPSPDGAQVAVEARELHFDVWRADGLGAAR